MRARKIAAAALAESGWQPSDMARPRVKPEHVPYRIGDGKIRIGGVSYGVAAEIDDPDGWV